MEIKFKLDKPYTDIERTDFILNYGQNCLNKNPECYEIKETATAIEAWGYTQEEKQEQEKQKTIANLKAQLDVLDLKSIRAIRANDTEYIAQYETQAEALREQIRELQAE